MNSELFKKYVIMLVFVWMNSICAVMPYFSPEDSRFHEIKKIYLPLGKAIMGMIPAVVVGVPHLSLCVGMAVIERTLELARGKQKLLEQAIQTGDVEGFKSNLYFFLDFYIVDSSQKLKKQINENCDNVESKKEMIEYVEQQKVLAHTVFDNCRKLEQIGFTLTKNK